jgi:hypothetical protein
VHRTPRPRALAALVLAAAALSASCATGNDAQTDRIEPDNVSADIGALKLRNVVVVAEATGGDRAAVSAYIANEGGKPETLRSVTVEGAARVKLRPSGGVALPPGQAVLIGGPGDPTAVASGVTARPGDYLPVTFDFTGAGPARVNAFVVSGTGEYASFAPPGGTLSPNPTSSLTTSPTASPKGTGSAAPGPTGSVAPGGGAATAQQSARPTETASGGASAATGSSRPTQR